MRPLLTLVFVSLLTGMALSYLAMALLPVLFDLSMVELMDITSQGGVDGESTRSALALFLVQGLSTLGFFLLPGWWFFQNHRELLQARFEIKVSAGLGGAALTVLCLPMVYNLFHLNQGLPYSPIAQAYPAIKKVSMGWLATEHSSVTICCLLWPTN